MLAKELWDTDSFCDGQELDGGWDGTEEDMKAMLENICGDTLLLWQSEELENHDANPHNWTEEQIENWDYMIYNCFSYIVTCDADTWPEDWSVDDDGITEWYPEDDFLESIWWVTYDRLLELYDEYSKSQTDQKIS